MGACRRAWARVPLATASTRNPLPAILATSVWIAARSAVFSSHSSAIASGTLGRDEVRIAVLRLPDVGDREFSKNSRTHLFQVTVSKGNVARNYPMNRAALYRN